MLTDYLPCVSSCRAPLDNSSRVAKRPHEYIETARLTCKGGTSERSETDDSCDNDHISFRLTGDACAADAVQSADGPRLPGSRSDFPRPRFSLAPGSGPDGASRGSPDLATSQSRPVQGWALLLALDSGPEPSSGCREMVGNATQRTSPDPDPGRRTQLDCEPPVLYKPHTQQFVVVGTP